MHAKVAYTVISVLGAPDDLLEPGNDMAIFKDYITENDASSGRQNLTPKVYCGLYALQRVQELSCAYGLAVVSDIHAE